MAHDITITFDTVTDVVYVHFRSLAPAERIARTVHLDEFRNVDYDANGEVVGVEFLCVSEHVELNATPREEEVREIWRRLPVPA